MSIRGYILPFFNSNFVNELFCYEKSSIEPIGTLTYLAAGFAMVEQFCTRLYILNTFKKSPNRQPGFFHLLKLSTSEEVKKAIFVTKITNFAIIYVAIFLFQLLLIIPALHMKSIFGRFMALFWMVMAIIGPTFGGPDVNTMANVASVCFGVIMRYSKELVEDISTLTKSPSLVTKVSLDHIFRQYNQILLMIKTFSQLSMIFMLLFHILVIPIYSVVLYEFSLSVHSIQLILKVISMVTGTIYCLRGYVLTALLAEMDIQSKRLHSSFMSLVARRPLPVRDKSKILFILEDLANPRNHWAISEYGGHKVTRMDVVNSIFGTLQLIMLAFDLNESLG